MATISLAIRLGTGMLLGALAASAVGINAAKSGASITVVRAGCFFECPEYAVTIRADGRVAFRGIRHVDVPGDRTWRIPPAEAAELLELIQDPTLWTAPERYVETGFDGESMLVRIRSQGRVRDFWVYPAQNEEAPAAFREAALAIAGRTDVSRWVRLSTQTLDALSAEGFDFQSEQGRELLYRSIRPRMSFRFDEDAVLALLARGAPAESGPVPSGRTPLDTALSQRAFRLVEPLIAQGVLLTDGQPDPDKLNSAFRSAIRSGRLEWVERIWSIAGPAARPALDVEAQELPSLGLSGPVSVAVALRPDSDDDAWEGEQIARWLEEQGVDFSPRNGLSRTLLRNAMAGNDPGLLLFLLARGHDPNTLHEQELLRAAGDYGEDTTLALLDAMAAHERPVRHSRRFRRVAELREWPRVIAWLDANTSEAERHPQASTPCD